MGGEARWNLFDVILLFYLSRSGSPEGLNSRGLGSEGGGDLDATVLPGSGATSLKFRGSVRLSLSQSE